jgi:hypothetical protein
MAAVLMLKFIVCFAETTHEPLHLDELWYSKRSWTYLQVLIESLFCLTQFLLNMTMVRNFEVMLG